MKTIQLSECHICTIPVKTCLLITVKMVLLIWLSVFLVLTCNGQRVNKYEHYLDDPAVKLFREYLQIDTSKAENIQTGLDFWIHQANDVGLPYAVYSPAGKPIFVATLEGSDPSLPSIMLNSHMDVVTVDASEWKYPPFAAYMDENGDIYARGAQDTKDIAIQYLEAIKRLKNDNVTLPRTLHITIMTDEESGSAQGMRVFVNTTEFKTLNVGFALDEGQTTPGDTILASFVDKRAWSICFTIRGVGGHGSLMPDGTAMDNGGLAKNVIATEIKAIMDMRLATDANPKDIETMINSWLRAAGNNNSVTYLRHDTESGITSVDSTNPFWVSMQSTLSGMGIRLEPVVKAAMSDATYLRNKGIPTLGFATKTKTIPRLHAKDEYQNVETFLRGIDIYTEVLKGLANVPSS
ncbi:aminoacylase-1-like isoform X4 [Spodoptera litura]|uniref:Aminoacylase-1-like isoform X4 n=1 Tax=Spodoptera litura TaxID=69820 RepID=A0A9J7IHD7_SPOLT|nr:aminoacylase-1-like isoform X4 [Spodoptera litura]